MKNNCNYIALAMLVFVSPLHAAAQEDDYAQGPMSIAWFNKKDNPFKQANNSMNAQQWHDAETRYNNIERSLASLYDIDMADINEAQAAFAQGRSIHKGKGFAAFDNFLGIADAQKLPDHITQHHSDENNSVLVHTRHIGHGDIVHFLACVYGLKKAGYNVTVAVRDFFLPCVQPALTHYGASGIKESKIADHAYDYHTHLMSLFSKLKYTPSDIKPAYPLYTTQESALEKVEAITRSLNDIAFVFLGHHNAAALMGGRELPAPSRHLNKESFNALLRAHPHLTIVDCGMKDEEKFHADVDVQDRVVALPKDHAFDTIVAAALIMSRNKQCVAFGPDQGPPAIFMRALDPAEQTRMGIILPIKTSHDMRTEKLKKDPTAKQYDCGESYQHMISNCRVFRCNSHRDQAAMIALAYKEIHEHAHTVNEAVESVTKETPENTPRAVIEEKETASVQEQEYAQGFFGFLLKTTAGIF